MLTNKLFNKAFLFALTLCLLVGVLVLVGCENETEPQFIDRQFVPAGTWADDYETSYVITKDEVEYDTAAFGNPEDTDYWPATNLSGTIIIAVDFTETSGVLIIKVADNDYIGLSKDDYTCVYYKDYSASHIYLANPIDAVTYAPIKASALNTALKTFTEGNVGTYVTEWGSGYNFKE
jgi:uncharacterized lipoprotein NlpE involved in copper resistance